MVTFALMQKINEILSIGDSLTMIDSDVQLFAIRSVEESADKKVSMYVAYDEESEKFYFTDNLDIAEVFDGEELTTLLEDVLYDLRYYFKHTFVIEFIGNEIIVDYGKDC